MKEKYSSIKFLIEGPKSFREDPTLLQMTNTLRPTDKRSRQGQKRGRAPQEEGLVRRSEVSWSPGAEERSGKWRERYTHLVLAFSGSSIDNAHGWLLETYFIFVLFLLCNCVLEEICGQRLANLDSNPNWYIIQSYAALEKKHLPFLDLISPLYKMVLTIVDDEGFWVKQHRSWPIESTQ